MILKIVREAGYDIYARKNLKKVTAKGTQNVNSYAASVQILELERINKEASGNILVAFLFHCDSPQES